MNDVALSTTALWIGRILKTLLCLFLLFDCITKIIKHPKSVEGTKQFGLPESSVQFLGFYLLLATLLYIFPKTSVHGMLLLIAYLGGAVALTYLNKPAAFGYLFAVVFAVLLVLAEFLLNSNFKNVLSLK